MGKMFVILCSLLLAGCAITTGDSSYDYSASVECLPEPMDPHYGGGLISNPNFDAGLADWEVYGNGKIVARKSESGNNFMVAYNRINRSDSFSRSFYLQKDLLYTFSAWLQTNKQKAIINAFLKIPQGNDLIIGSVIAQSGCWSMLKGGFTVDQDMKAELFFWSENTENELWLDNVSLKPFTKIEWTKQQNRSIDKVRKRTIRIHVTSANGLKLNGANITIDQTRPHFLIGCSTTDYILNTTAYQDWFVSRRFPATTFNNQMKWYFTEPNQGQVNYTVTDAMVDFFKKNNVSIRGHAIHWASENVTQDWVKALSPRETLNAVVRRMGSVVSRYSGDVIAWDVMNENMHNSYYEDKIGKNSSSMVYQIAHAMDPETPLFLNEFNTLEYPNDMNVIPSKYVEKIRETRAFPGNEHLAIRIGLQGHFILRPNISHTRAVFDYLGVTKMPIWLTELDTKRGPTQAAQLEDIMREAFSHPAVEGIIVWAGWKSTICSQTCLEDKNYDVLPKGCSQMCLTDTNFTNLPTGDVVDKLLKEWRTTNVTGTTNEEGVFEQNVFHGEYSLTYSHPLIPRTVERKFNVTNDKGVFDLYVTYSVKMICSLYVCGLN